MDTSYPPCLLDFLGEDQTLTLMKGEDSQTTLCEEGPTSPDSGMDSPYSNHGDIPDDLFSELGLTADSELVNFITNNPEETSEKTDPQFSLSLTGKITKCAKVTVKSSDTYKDNTDTDGFAVEKSRRNAIQAKLNREKKKQYMSTLENESKTLKSENASLKTKNEQLEMKQQSLEGEVEYLKNVLANQSSLAGLLQNIPNVTGVKLTSSFLRKRGAAHDHDYQKSKRHRSTNNTAGICLHVDKDTVSLEFCASCSTKAKITAKDIV